MPERIVLFVSPGRAGTQWLTQTLHRAYPDEAVVEHEPLREAYNLRKFLRNWQALYQSEEAGPVLHHFEEIADVPDDLPYIETGWPVLALIPAVEREFGDKVRVVQLLRNPVHNAISLMTHGMHSPGHDEAIAGWQQLVPTDNVVQTNYAGRWERLSPFERCLFQWTEVHLYGEELGEWLGPGRFLRVRAEDMFDPDSRDLADIVEFCGLPPRPRLQEQTRTRVDRYRQSTDVEFDWRRIFDHEKVLELCERYGYRFDDIRAEALDRRYRRHFANRIRDASRAFARTWRRNLGLGK